MMFVDWLPSRSYAASAMKAKLGAMVLIASSSARNTLRLKCGWRNCLAETLTDRLTGNAADVECDVGVADERENVVGIIREAAEADAGRHREVAPLQCERSSKCAARKAIVNPMRQSNASFDGDSGPRNASYHPSARLRIARQVAQLDKDQEHRLQKDGRFGVWECMTEAIVLRYPARFEPVDGGGFVVTFRDVPEAIAQGETIEEALVMAANALATAMDFYFEDRRPIPAPSEVENGEEPVALSVSMSDKVLAFNKMLAKK